MKAAKAYKTIKNICYEESGHPELHREILSIDNGLGGGSEISDEDYIKVIGEVLEAIYTFAPDFDPDKYSNIEELYAELSEQI